MNTDLSVKAALALGGILQWFRAQVKFPDWLYVAIIGVAAVAIAWMAGLSLGALFGPDRASAWLEVGSIFGTTLSATQAVSCTANIVAAINPKLKSNPIVPVTNSKGGTP